ncbi:hypothetical protein GCM10011512_02550 [Tersicoccus solisilvae]|uniref:DNA-binding protein n=1 Tax=Tersicoccus solisilvae TaxID=1882339 RepID=A0ABQ1NKH8_9MICC|nr:hypothetical protein [Tersicoccus solisilvae]GGC79394.1 hypothetical protein GCM10011512_02550 [Tersicoccus solisilvae]
MSTPLPTTSAPAQRALAAQGIATLEQLSTYPEAWVASLHGVGPKVMRMLRAALADAGLGFAAHRASNAPHDPAAPRTDETAGPQPETGDHA